MIYRAPERAVPARSRAVTHELAALLVGMALLAAVILQVACTGAGGRTGRWLCVNNPRLASLRPTPPPSTATPRAARGSAIRPAGAATRPIAGAEPAAPSAATPDAFAPSPFDPGTAFTAPTPAAPGADPASGRSPDAAVPAPDAALSQFSSRRATMTAVAQLEQDAATQRAAAPPTPAPLATATPTLDPTVTPGPGTPSATAGPSPTGSATATETGYPGP